METEKLVIARAGMRGEGRVTESWGEGLVLRASDSLELHKGTDDQTP